ncbi:Rv1733c family protein [Streptomyces viridochromogenes]|uniref:Rv1733c family protein n=1 Tax=Streptomyces viridochromogenes TaxID=1938 RepID=UPI000A3855CB
MPDTARQAGIVRHPLVGVVAGWCAHGDARATAEKQRAERRQVPAMVVRTVSGALHTPQTGRRPSAKVTVRWTEPATGPRTTAVRVPTGTRPGETVHVWLDAAGRSVHPPPDDFAVRQHAVTMGVRATGASAAVVVLGHRLVRHAAMRRRLAEWDRAWAATEPAWTGRGV